MCPHLCIAQSRYKPVAPSEDGYLSQGVHPHGFSCRYSCLILMNMVAMKKVTILATVLKIYWFMLYLWKSLVCLLPAVILTQHTGVLPDLLKDGMRYEV